MEDAFKLQVIGPDLYENTYKNPTRRTVYGGHLAAVAVKAALLTFSPSSTNVLINSVHASFIRPAKKDISVTYKVYDKKDGALFSHRSVSATQEGKLVFTCFVSFKATTGDNEAGKQIHNDQEKPLVPGPDHPENIPDLFSSFPINVVECHLPNDTISHSSSDETTIPITRQYYWIKPKMTVTYQDKNYDRIVILYASDIALFGIILADCKYSFFTSLDLSVWFNESSHEIDANKWYLYDTSSTGTPIMSKIYSEDGRLVATAVQQAYVESKL